MSRGLAAAAACTLGVVSLATLLWAASGDAEDTTAVRPPEVYLAAHFPPAAAAAYGRRVLVLHDHGARIRGDVYESARFGGGWELYPAAPPGASRLAVRLAAVADRAAADLQADRRLSTETQDTLARHAIAIVLVENGKLVIDPPATLRTGRLTADAGVRGLRVRGAELVWRLTADGEETAPVLDPSDGLWGGGVTVEAPSAGTYRFAWGREGARVRVDGADAEPTALEDDVFLHLELPAGRSRVDVAYVDDGSRGLAAIAGSAGLVAALIMLLLLFRPRLAHDQVE